MVKQNENQLISILLLGVLLAILNGRGICAQGPLGRSEDYGHSGGGGDGTGAGAGDNGNGNGGGEIMVPKATALNSHEPTCEELRAMWRFSKRQSRASEITNEIPTYRDPFVYNIWEPYYPTTRSFGGVRVSPRYRDSSRPVYGRIIHKEPLIRFRDLPERNRALDDVTRIYGAENKALDGTLPRRRIMQFRFSGSGGSSNQGSMASGGGGNNVGVSGTNSGGGAPQNSVTPQRGSFQRLKELIWTERAKELAQQRRLEEMAARAAVLKEIANGQSYTSNGYRNHGSANQYDFNTQRESEDRMGDLNRDLSPISSHHMQDISSDGILPFPDMLAPTGISSSGGGKNSGVSRAEGSGLSMPLINDYPQMGNRKNTYSHYIDDIIAEPIQSSLPPSYLRSQQQSHFRERNRAILRHGFPNVQMNGSRRRQFLIPQ